MANQNNCKDCKFFNRLSADSKNGMCLNVDVMLADDDRGIEMYDKKMDSDMIVVGQNFGCIHFEDEQQTGKNTPS